MTRRNQHRKRPTVPPPPATVTIPLPLLEAARAVYPQARDWPDSQVAAAREALAIRLSVPRNGLVHGE